jgi:hypothetical protein
MTSVFYSRNPDWQILTACHHEITPEIMANHLYPAILGKTKV